jgi:hypothetical protein
MTDEEVDGFLEESRVLAEEFASIAEASHVDIAQMTEALSLLLAMCIHHMRRDSREEFWDRFIGLVDARVADLDAKQVRH